ncbi:hypothetical protein HWI79_1984 [Cryptosporidium felis]|nr:hypothetical protein HWI79_1984 [Cryptosporidium felis]
MKPEAILKSCEEFLNSNNYSDNSSGKAIQGYTKFFEELTKVTSILNLKIVKNQECFEFYEIWNSILHCYKVTLENLWFEFNSKDSNSLVEFSHPSTEFSGIHISPSICLQEIFELVKVLTSTCEKMKVFLENDIGFTRSSSTSGLSIVLILVKVICHKSRKDYMKIHEKACISSLYCLNLLFLIYKVEFTENWDIILIAKEINGMGSDATSSLNKLYNIGIEGERDIPFLAYLLFSSNQKIITNAILCIQSIFAAPIIKFQSMISLFNKSLSKNSMDTIACSLHKNLVLLTSTLLFLGELMFKSGEYNNESKTTLIKAISRIICKTPFLFWVNNSVTNENSFIECISKILFSSLKDMEIIIPSLQLFSNLSTLIKNCTFEDISFIKQLLPSFRRVLAQSCSLLGIPGYCKIKKNIPFPKLQTIVEEVLNFYTKLANNCPYFFFLLNESDRADFDSQFFDHLGVFLDILRFIIFEMSHNLSIYSKGLKTVYVFINSVNNLWKVNFNKINSTDIYLHESIIETSNIQTFTCILISREETYTRITKFLELIIDHIFDGYLYEIINLRDIGINFCKCKCNLNLICDLLSIFSVVNPVVIEMAYLKKATGNSSTYNTGFNMSSVNKENSKSQVVTPNFLYLLLSSIDQDLEDRVHSSIINVILCYCHDSNWLKYSTFNSFQQFESTLIEKFKLLINSKFYYSKIGIKENTIKDMNKAILSMTMYHKKNIDQVVVCSKKYKSYGLIQGSLSNNETDPDEICCLSDWKGLLLSYKQLAQYHEFHLKSNNIHATPQNSSEFIRLVGRISKLVRFDSRDFDLILWILNVLNSFISNVKYASLKHSKLKWNSIYSIGQLMQNTSFNSLLLQDITNNPDNLSDIVLLFTSIWSSLCSILRNNTELVKVRISALRSLSEFCIQDFNFKIPQILLIKTWEAFFAALDTAILQPCSNFNESKSSLEYSILWKTYLRKLGDTLYRDSKYYLTHCNHKVLNFEKKLITRFCSDFPKSDI